MSCGNVQKPSFKMVGFSQRFDLVPDEDALIALITILSRTVTKCAYFNLKSERVGLSSGSQKVKLK